MTKVSFRPAVLDDIKAFYGVMPDRTVRAYVAEKDGERVGIFGLEKYGNTYVAFSDIDHNSMKLKKDIVRAAKFLRGVMESLSIPVIAVCNQEIPNSDRFLRFVGFAQVNDEVYVWRS